jgi:hypothetical protein
MMKRHKYILIIIFVLTVGTAFAHQDFWVTKDFGNVKVRIKTGFEYEEINKVCILGELAEKLSSELGYKEQIFLDFNHHYTGDCEPDYFISFDKGTIEYSWSGAEKQEPPLPKKAIVIRQVSRQFDTKTTLKLVEYAIKNLSVIKSNQKLIEYNENYCQWRIQTIDSLKIKEIINIPTSQKINSVLSTKIEIPEKEFYSGITYYFQNSLFNINFKDYNEQDTTLLRLNNIYQISKPTNSHFAFIFDTDSTFYFVNSRKVVSKRQRIIDTHDFYRPFNIEYIGGDKYSIHFWYYSKEPGPQPKYRTLIYQSDKDKVIQDLDKLIEKNE